MSRGKEFFYFTNNFDIDILMLNWLNNEVSMRKPIIGIVAKYVEEVEGRQEAMVRDELKNAILDNGGIVIGILPSETKLEFTPIGKDSWDDYLSVQQKNDLICQINLCDGIILQGGKDSLKYESFIAKYTFDNDIPTLGVCAGQNAMVRAVGGTTKRVLNPEKHKQMRAELVHKIFIDENSKFFKIVGLKEMMVNSRHNKTIDDPTENYKVSAVCEDGYPDVIEAQNKKFNIALRFHPESLYKKYKEHNNIFKAFVEECKKSCFR